MRKFIENFEITGTLEIEGLKTYENILCIYEDDYYSNHYQNCKFKFEHISVELHNKLNPPYPNFTFTGNDYKILQGKCNGISMQTYYEERKEYVLGSIDEIYSNIIFSDNVPSEYVAYFYIPYVKLLSRNIEYNFLKKEDWILEYTSQSLSFQIDQKEITVDEQIKLIEYEKPDSIFNRQIKICIKSKTIKKDIDVIKSELISFMNIFVASLSLILFHRINWYAFFIYLYDENDKRVSEFYQKRFNQSIGEDYLKEINDKRELNKFLTGEKIGLLLRRVLEFSEIKAKELLRIFYSYITINEIIKFEPQFLEAYFTLVAISKHIFNPQQNTNEVELIRVAMDAAGIPFDEINFADSISIKRKGDSKAEWLIYEYRNYLVHFNNVEFNYEELFSEYKKILRLTRKLIFFAIDPSLRDFPVPGE
jgi:hypothetical protein